MEGGHLIPGLVDKQVPDVARDLHQHLRLLVVVKEPPLLTLHQLHTARLTSFASMRDSRSSRICYT
jgi:hypothetical protein